MPASPPGTNAQHLTSSTWPLQTLWFHHLADALHTVEAESFKGGGTYRLGSGVLSPHLTRCLFLVVAVRRGCGNPTLGFLN